MTRYFLWIDNVKEAGWCSRPGYSPLIVDDTNAFVPKKFAFKTKIGDETMTECILKFKDQHPNVNATP